MHALREECWLNSRERVIAALEHREPDRVPIDLGGSVSSIHWFAYKTLTQFLGLDLDIRIGDKIQQLAVLDAPVLERLGVDIRHVSLKKGFFIGGEDRLDDPSGRAYFIDDWGIKWAKNPYYYDMVDHPLKDATTEDLERYPWPDPSDPARYDGLREDVKHLYEGTEYAIVADAIFGGLFECAWWLRGFERFNVDLHKRPDFATGLLDKILELYLGFYGRYLDAVGDRVEMVELGDDLGAQTGPIISPQMFRKYLKPRYKKLYDFIHSKTKAKVFHHSCGAVYPFIRDLIEVGVDVLNPIQPRAAMMDIGRIKREFGGLLSLHGGVDIQRVLPYGTAEDVAAEVKRVIGLGARGGGYILAGAHNIQADTPVENIWAMFEAAKTYGVYPIRA